MENSVYVFFIFSLKRNEEKELSQNAKPDEAHLVEKL